MKTKKISWQAIAIVVLALVLIASIALGVSGAWFQDNDAVQQTSKMGEAVTIRLGDTSATDPVDTWSTLYKSTNPYPGDTIMGQTQIYMGSETPSVVRGKVIVSVQKPKEGGGTEDVALPTVTETVLTEPTKPNKSDDKYWKVTDGISTFNQTEYDNDLTAYTTAAETYNLQMLARMLAVTLDKENSGWVKSKSYDSEDSEKYFYYNAIVKSTSAIKLFDKLELANTLTNEIANWTISVKVSVQAIQAANLCDAAGVAINTEWFNDLPDSSTVRAEVVKYNGNTGEGRVK